VPRLYLKHFASKSGDLFRYRTLVSSANVAEWKKVNISGVGYQPHLYTRALSDGESDEFEQWLNRDFETPAALSLEKAVHDMRLEKEDYRLLVRFLVAQVVRTPAFLIENLPTWRKFAVNQLENLSKTVTARLKSEHQSGTPDREEPWKKLRGLSLAGN